MLTSCTDTSLHITLFVKAISSDSQTTIKRKNKVSRPPEPWGTIWSDKPAMTEIRVGTGVADVPRNVAPFHRQMTSPPRLTFGRRRSNKAALPSLKADNRKSLMASKAFGSYSLRMLASLRALAFYLDNFLIATP